MKTIFSVYFVLILNGGLMAQDFALNQLENSPRHHEWVTLNSGERKVECFIAYPEVTGKAPAVIIIHENKGLTDWVRSFADQLAAQGYIAIAPDLLSDFSADMKNTGSFKTQDDATKAIYQLNPDQVTADLNVVQAYISHDKACNGKTAVIGFCWGGGQSFRFATNNTAIKVALVFYGSSPDKAAEIQRITAPVYGFYGERDERIDAGIPATDSLMKSEDKKYDYKIYPGATHAYMRMGDDPAGSPENKKARDDSWKRILAILKEI